MSCACHEGLCVGGGIAPCIVNLHTGWRWLVSLTPSLPPRKVSPPVTNTELGNETGKFQNIKKKSTHEFFICLLVINEKHMNSHFVLSQSENLITSSRWLPFRCTQSSSQDLKLFMTSRSISTRIAATSTWIHCFKSAIVLGYPCVYRIVWWNRSVTRNIEMSAERAPSPHQTLSILIISLNGESTPHPSTAALLLNGRSYRRGEASSLPPHSTTVSPTSPYFFPVSLPNPILWIVGPYLFYLFEIARVQFHWSNLFMNLKSLVTAGPLRI
jgi:hypothetical protein